MTASLSTRFSSRLVRGVTFALSMLAVSVAIGCSGSDATGPNRPSNPAAENFASALGVNLENMTEREARLYVQDLVVGTGAEASVGDSLRVRYTGWLRTGVQFDSNVSAGSPFDFKIGSGRVIRGWELGTPGMRVGGKRRIVMGSEYGYGQSGSGQIPRNATLVFDVELISIVN